MWQRHSAKKLGKLFRAVFVSIVLLLPSAIFAEQITSFDVDITIKPDGRLEVHEAITYDFEDAMRHGIYRTIDANHPEAATAWYKKRIFNAEVKNILRNGLPEQYEEENDGALSVRIGDPDSEITGAHVYELYYTLDGVILTTEENITELYWNVTGNRWGVPIRDVTVTVHTDAGVDLRDAAACYAGVYGVSKSCSDRSITASSTVFRQEYLAVGEGLTIAQALDFENTSPLVIEKWDWFAIFSAVVGFIVPLFIFLGSVLLSVKVWFTYRKHYFKSTVVAQYEAYEDISPLYTGVLLDGRLDKRDVTAALVSLAARGFITIEYLQKETWWKSDDYKITLKKAPDDTVVLAENNILNIFFTKLFVGESIQLSSLKNSTARQTNAKLFTEINEAVKNDLEKANFFEKVWKRMITRRTRRGYEAMYYLKGLKKFLSVTEKERYTFHNAPQLNSGTFMQFLPYAVALGVEKEWAEAFKDIPLELPDWYKGDSGGFNPVAFSAHMNNLTAAVASGTTVSSSGGSGGGGFSGGGVGGGGGGSW